MKRNLYNDSDSSWTYLLILTIPFAVGIFISAIFQIIATRYGIADFKKNTVMTIIYIFLISLSYLAIFLIYNKKQKVRTTKASLIKIKFGWINLILCVLIAFITLFGFNSLINYLFHLLEKVGYNPDASLPLPLTNGWWLTLNIFLLAVLPAVFEELIYRGIILNGLRRFGAVNAVVISALLFALAHGSAMQFFYQFILGIVLGFVIIKTGSVIASMVVHFLNNAIVLIVGYIDVKFPQSSSITFTTDIIIFSFVIAISSAGLLILLISRLKEKKKEDKISYNEEYEKIYEAKTKKFSNDKTKLVFFVACVISVIFWAMGTFLQ